MLSLDRYHDLMMNSGMYHTLSRFGPLRRSFAAKIMMVAFLGTQATKTRTVNELHENGNQQHAV